ncbi:hypothetical protein FRUB_09503 [Fimbriiglobus ruber]|uniref:Uncharacterized protein n=1 Tax=Fimbriiglobus ruber TaxID=1908690 RepID=A0A225D1E9_9BACT|nr:hypothetical protein FRUB_09503 [Fimbriiglobus ruber]
MWYTRQLADAAGKPSPTRNRSVFGRAVRPRFSRRAAAGTLDQPFIGPPDTIPPVLSAGGKFGNR